MPSKSEVRRRPGPKPLVTKQLLLEAGARAVASSEGRRAETTRVSRALGIQLADVLAVCGEMLTDTGRSPRPVAPPALYKHWDDFEDFTKDLISELFNPGGFDLDHLKQPVPLHVAVGRHALADKSQMSAHQAGVFFALFREMGDPRVAEALRDVYEAYDREVVPLLAGAIEAAGRRPKVSLGADGVTVIATALTALSEGLMLRTMATPEATQRDCAWRDPAVALVLGMTEEIQPDVSRYQGEQ